MSRSCTFACSSEKKPRLFKINHRHQFVPKWVFTWLSITYCDPHRSLKSNKDGVLCSAAPVGILLIYATHFKMAAHGIDSRRLSHSSWRIAWRRLLDWIMPAGSPEASLPQTPSLCFAVTKQQVTSNNEAWHFLPQASLAHSCMTKDCFLYAKLHMLACEKEGRQYLGLDGMFLNVCSFLRLMRYCSLQRLTDWMKSSNYESVVLKYFLRYHNNSGRHFCRVVST